METPHELTHPGLMPTREDSRNVELIDRTAYGTPV